jgi:xanthine dehydrogenase accessory factor
VPIACQSEGALEVYVEPVLPQPQLIAIGRSPVAASLAQLAAGLGWRSVHVDEDAEPTMGDVKVLTTLDLEAADVDARSYIVVATQGHYRGGARALETPAATWASWPRGRGPRRCWLPA